MKFLQFYTFSYAFAGHKSATANEIIDTSDPSHLIAENLNECGSETFSRIVGGGIAKPHTWER